MLTINQKLSQQQKLTPQQIQYQKLLQLNAMNLEQRIKEELEINPALELETNDEIELSLEDLGEKEEELEKSETESEEEVDSAEKEEINLEEFMHDGDVEIFKANKSEEEENYQLVPPKFETLTDKLIEQLHLSELNDNQISFGELIIGNLDSDGYLKRDIKDLIEEARELDEIEITDEEAYETLNTIQNLDPPGIAARNLQECLLIQLRKGKFEPYYKFLAEEILTKAFNDFVNKRYDAIQKNLNMTVDNLKKAIEIINKLNPKPGEGNIISEMANQITPDFIVEKIDDDWVVTLNDRIAMSVTLRKEYLDMLEKDKGKRKISENEKEMRKFLKEKIDSAKWFIASIQQRRQTLLKIMQAIVEEQRDFFEEGPKALKPMIYKDIADKVGMDISTISRVVNGKYVQSSQGIHELKYFFSEGLSSDNGEDVSNKKIKELIKEIISNEPKDSPYSDEEIAEILNEQGIHIARRTVAKYREQLKLPVARLRKQL
jgi:RNA polymerase sigma-54 factor